jgi:transposase
MYITTVVTKTKSGEISHTCKLLRYSYREDGKVKNKTIANLNHLPEIDAKAIEYAMEHKHEIPQWIEGKPSQEIKQGLSCGAVYLLKELADRLGITKALGKSEEAKRALWLIFARIIDQGSCLSAVRLAATHAACDVLDINESFDEDDLYKDLAWLTKNQRKIEKKLFSIRYKDEKPDLFLYDVTSSYLEGKHNAFAYFGYNRDKKQGKMQIVAGLMCDKYGDPITIEVFDGNTLDYKTVHNQIDKVSKDYGCSNVTLVGDRGMIKSDQIEELNNAGFHYITAITKSQIKKLINDDVIQMSMFDNDLKEIESDGVRYILRCNPLRTEEIRWNRSEKLKVVRKLLEERNEYLRDHPRAKVETAMKKVNSKIGKLKMKAWLFVESVERKLELRIDQGALDEISELDGCYVIISDLDKSIKKEEIHGRYKDLYSVEQAFRCSKTEMIEMRPWYVQCEDSTRGKALVVMLAYLMVRHLKKMWSEMNLTVKEGIKLLSTLCTVDVTNKGKTIKGLVPKPNDINAQLLKLAGVKMPPIIPSKGIIVVSRKKLVRPS